MRHLAVRLGVVLLGLSLPLHAADPVAGKFWYEQNCARCHGSPPQERQAGTPNITGYPAERIRYAIGNVVAMTKVRLDEAQVLDVEAYLQRPLDFLWVPGVNYSDLWWTPSESGWGLTLVQRPNARLAGVLFIYAADGSASWFLLADMQWPAATTTTGRLLRTRASAGFPLAGFDPATLSLGAAGDIVLRFASPDTAELEFTIDGRRFRRAIERTRF
jgi:hypothetical protein